LKCIRVIDEAGDVILRPGSTELICSCFVELDMNAELSPEHSILPPREPLGSRRKPSNIRGIFLGPNGIRAGWRFALFLALLAIFRQLIIQRGLRLIPGFLNIAKATQGSGVLTPEFQLMLQAAAILTVFLAAAIMSRIEKRSFDAYGLSRQGAFGRLFWQGVAWGLAFETVEMLAIYAFGGFSFGTLALASSARIKYALLWAIGFLLVGIFEEFLFRGYSQFTLGSGIGFWPAAFLLSAAFGAAHLGNSGEGWAGALSVFALGMFGCFALRRTGNLWFIIGFHAAMDYAETFIYSTPDSGFLAEGHLLNSSFHGPRWLTGGTIGPEGSVMEFVVFLLTFLFFNLVYPVKNRQIGDEQLDRRGGLGGEASPQVVAHDGTTFGKRRS
jgi:membrane protease YdiL (CAAX protease family)